MNISIKNTKNRYIYGEITIQINGIEIKRRFNSIHDTLDGIVNAIDKMVLTKIGRRMTEDEIESVIKTIEQNQVSMEHTISSIERALKLMKRATNGIDGEFKFLGFDESDNVIIQFIESGEVKQVQIKPDRFVNGVFNTLIDNFGDNLSGDAIKSFIEVYFEVINSDEFIVRLVHSMNGLMSLKSIKKLVKMTKISA